jgi:hypothetical protein
MANAVAVHHTVKLGALPQLTAAEAATMPSVVIPFRTGVDPVTFAAKKARAAELRFPAPQWATDPPVVPRN